MLTVKEPARKESLLQGVELAQPTLKAALQLIWVQRKAYFPICAGTAFTAFTNYGSSAWIPSYFVRTFGWSMQKTGLSYGLLITVFSALGVLAGGWVADWFSKNGRPEGNLGVGLISGIGILISCFNFLLPNPNWVLFSLAIPAFFIAFPLGAAGAAIQEIMPSRVRALATSIFLFFINIIGMGLGPLLVAFFTDSVFHDEMMIKYSLIALYITGGLATILCFWVGMVNYDKALLLKDFSKSQS